jgi:hypothetical protein
VTKYVDRDDNYVMANVVLGDLLDKQDKEVEAIGKAILGGKRDEAVSGLAGLAATVFSGLPIGGLVKEGVAKAFASPANVVLEQQIEAWNKEQEGTRQVAAIKDAIEVLLGQTLIQVVKSQHAVDDGVVAALGGLRDDLAEFRATVSAGLGDAAVHVDLHEVTDGAVGIHVRGRAASRVFIKRLVSTGKGTTGIVIG